MCFKQLFPAQEGTYDYGLFAVAYATSAAHGQDPAKCTYDQKQMRQHLYRCLCNGKITPFPLKSSSSSSRVITSDNIEVHCHCRMPELKNVATIVLCGIMYFVRMSVKIASQMWNWNGFAVLAKLFSSVAS